MDHPGFEPGTSRLKAEYSSIELVVQSGTNQIKFSGDFWTMDTL